MKAKTPRTNWLPFALLAACGSAQAYEPSTHSQLSRLAFDGSTLADSARFNDLGFSPTALYREVNIDGAFVASQTAREVVAFGAFTEDEHHQDRCTLGWMRPFNHFLDPQHGGRALQFPAGVTLGHPSADWALEDNVEVMTKHVPCMAAGDRPQNFSYRNAQSDLYSALTLPTPAEREASMALVLQKLGHVMHHVQDMAQPAHTRNEAHSPINPPERAWIEAYTETNVNNRIPGIVSANPYPVPTLPRARDYWHTSGASGPMYVGMAEFTSQNFISQSTGFQSLNTTVLPNPEFPLPNGQGKSIGVRSVTIRLHDNSQWTGNMAVVTGSIFDGNYSGGSRTEQVLATQSLLDRPLNNRGYSKLFGVNTYVYENQYSVLFPRAVAFSAGIINHFFAGKLAVSRASSGSGWTIANAAAESMNGSFLLYYQTSSGQRSLVSGGVWTGTLQAGQSTPTLPEPPNTATQVVGVFFGTIGSETMPRAAGKVTNYQPAPVPCGQPISAAGSSEGTTVVHELGTQAGPVQVEFEAYSIPDAFEIRQVLANGSLGTTHATTNGRVSGWHTWTFQHNPATSGSTRVRVRVTGNEDPGTLWTATVSCPNQSLDNGDRLQDRISITLGRGGWSGAGCSAGYTDVNLNGTRVARLAFNKTGSGSSTNVTVTAGSHQQYSLTTTITDSGTPGFSCSGDGRVYYTDRVGKNFLSGNTGWIEIR